MLTNHNSSNTFLLIILTISFLFIITIHKKCFALDTTTVITNRDIITKEPVSKPSPDMDRTTDAAAGILLNKTPNNEPVKKCEIKTYCDSKKVCYSYSDCVYSPSLNTNTNNGCYSYDVLTPINSHVDKECQRRQDNSNSMTNPNQNNNSSPITDKAK